MKLQEITANIRLRDPWEAIDLGFAMVQAWAKSIYIPLAIVTFSIALLLYLVVPEDNFWLAGFIFWWLKPLYDRLVLHIISNKLFNNELSSWEALKALPFLIWNTGFFQSLTFRRLSMSRGFNLPIWQLEQLRGAERVKRQRLLHLASHSHAVWLTIAMVHIEMIFVFSLFALLFLFLPESLARDFLEGLFDNKVEYKFWIDILNFIFYVVVVTFVHPFYIAASFALYINRRTQLESWDIELDFRKMGERLTHLLKHTPPIFLCFLMVAGLSGATSQVHAENLTTQPQQLISSSDVEKLAQERLPANASKKIIHEVMLSRNLDDKKVVKRWVRKDKKKKKRTKKSESAVKQWLEPIAKFISFIVEFGLWILIAIGILLLIYYRDRWLHLFQRSQSSKDGYQSPEVMFGMDVRPESLPEDIIGEAQKYWQTGEQRAALSLLYRGALVRLINEDQVELEDSFTEGDVLRVSAKKLPKTKLNYLSKLTKQWQLIAYAHRIPPENEMQFLFTHWHSDFARHQVTAAGEPHE